MTIPSDEPADLSLVMPFTITASHGGPHDDDAFTSGFRLGVLWSQLQHAPPGQQGVATIRVEERDQLDLMLMHFGFTIADIDSHADEWLTVWIRRGTSVDSVT